MAAPIARMNDANRAMCYALRNPPPGTKKTSLKQIATMVVKTDGTHPTMEAVRVAAKEFGAEKQTMSVLNALQALVEQNLPLHISSTLAGMTPWLDAIQIASLGGPITS